MGGRGVVGERESAARTVHGCLPAYNTQGQLQLDRELKPKNQKPNRQTYFLTVTHLINVCFSKCVLLSIYCSSVLSQNEPMASRKVASRQNKSEKAKKPSGARKCFSLFFFIFLLPLIAAAGNNDDV